MPLLLAETGGYLLMEGSDPTVNVSYVFEACRTQDRVNEFALAQYTQLGNLGSVLLRFTTNPAVDLAARTFALYVSKTPDRVTADKTYTPVENLTGSLDATIDLTDSVYAEGNTYYGALYDITDTVKDLYATIVFSLLKT